MTSTKAFIEILLTCSPSAQARGLRVIEEYGINDRDLTYEEAEAAGKMLADIVNEDKAKAKSQEERKS